LLQGREESPIVSLMSIKPKVYTADDHKIRQEEIDRDALFVLETLTDAGFEAYLVGGGVRDLLLGRHPKDFDISTSARPEEVKQLFRRCLLIGRRFRLAHVRFGEKVIEVATFRAGDPEHDALIVRDNVWGTAESDALRRDFTLNGLYYDATSREVIDYCGGFQDLSAGLLRAIGNPVVRFRQDPVRMIRLLKFQARFGLKAEDEASKALRKCYQEIVKSAPARLLEEILRMIESGAAAPFFRLMLDHHLLPLLFPLVAECMRQDMGERIFAFLEAADHLIRSGVKLDRPALVGALLLPLLERLIEREYPDPKHPPNLGRIQELIFEVVEGALVEAFSHFPKRMRAEISFALLTQYRLTPVRKRAPPQSLPSHPDFPFALQLLRIRDGVDEGLSEELEKWVEISKKVTPRPKPKGRRRPRRRRR